MVIMNEGIPVVRRGRSNSVRSYMYLPIIKMEKFFLVILNFFWCKRTRCPACLLHRLKAVACHPATRDPAPPPLLPPLGLPRHPWTPGATYYWNPGPTYINVHCYTGSTGADGTIEDIPDGVIDAYFYPEIYISNLISRSDWRRKHEKNIIRQKT